MGGLDRRMRDRWQTVNRLWEANKAAANKLTLLGQLDYFGKLSAQLAWQGDPQGKRVRVVYTSAGVPTAAVIEDKEAIIDYKLFWIACRSMQEANYLLAIINSATLYNAATPLMSKGLWGARDLQKHLWRLPIPAFDANNALHVEVARAGRAAAAGAQRQLAGLREQRGDAGVAIVRRELRAWLKSSRQGQAVERAVAAAVGGLGGVVQLLEEWRRPCPVKSKKRG